MSKQEPHDQKTALFSQFFKPNCLHGKICRTDYCKIGVAAVSGDYVTMEMSCADSSYRHCHRTIDDQEQNSLHLAAMHGHGKVIQLLFDHGFDINARDKYGNTPIFLAILHHRLESAKLLLDLGADINIPNCKNRTILHEIALYNFEEEAKFLLKKKKEYGLEINFHDDLFRTPVDEAVYLNNADIAVLLVDNGATIGIHSRSRSLANLLDFDPFDLIWENSMLKRLILRGNFRLLDHLLTINSIDQKLWSLEKSLLVDFAAKCHPDADAAATHISNSFDRLKTQYDLKDQIEAEMARSEKRPADCAQSEMTMFENKLIAQTV